jgi:hypothetical protein
LWIRLKSVAVPEFARLNTGGNITRGNRGNGVLLIRENRAARQQKSRNGNSPSCLTPEFALPSQLYGLFTTTCGAGLLTLSYALTFEVWDACSSRRAVSCAIVAPKSVVVAGVKREGRLSDRKTGMCCKRVVDHKIPALASALAQG